MGEFNGNPMVFIVVGFQEIIDNYTDVNASSYDADGDNSAITYEHYANPTTTASDAETLGFENVGFSTEYKDGYYPLLLYCGTPDQIQAGTDCGYNLTTGPYAPAGNPYSPNLDWYRMIYGSNYWEESSLKRWLNSNASSVSYDYGSPSYQNSNGVGFLTNFTEAETAAMVTDVTQRTAVSSSYGNERDGGSEAHTYTYTIGQSLQNYNTTAYYKNTTDTVFVLDVPQIEQAYANLSNICKVNISDHSLLRCANADYSYFVRSIYSDGSVRNSCPYDTVGVRPAFYLNLQSVIFSSGEGTSDSPYSGIGQIAVIPVQTYTGSEIKPNVTITVDGTTFTAGTDYKVTYSDNINVGTATVKITGEGNYTGTITTTFNIIKAESQTSAENETVTYGDTLTLTANVSKASTYSARSLLSAAQDKVDFYVGDTLLGSTDVDYGESNSDSGTATIEIKTADKQLVVGENTITAEYGGSVNLNGSGSNSITVTLIQKEVGLTWSGYETRDYDGTASNITATATGLLDGDNVSVTVENGTQTNAGTYTAAVTSLTSDDENKTAGYYKLPETVTQTYTINGLDSVVTATPGAIENLVYNTSAQELITAGEATGGTLMYSLAENGDYKTDIPTVINAGDYTVWYMVAGDDNYNDVSAQSVQVSISKADITLSISMDSWTYGETASEPSVTGNLGDGAVTYQYKLSTAADDTYSDDKPTSAGIYTVKATVAETDNYNGNTATTSFTILEPVTETTETTTETTAEATTEATTKPTTSPTTGVTAVTATTEITTTVEDDINTQYDDDVSAGAGAVDTGDVILESPAAIIAVMIVSLITAAYILYEKVRRDKR